MNKTTTVMIESNDAESFYPCVANLYNELVLRYTGKRGWFDGPRVSEEKHKKNLERVHKLVQICTELDIGLEIFMKAQFEILVPYFKKLREQGKVAPSAPPFTLMVGDKAVERFSSFFNSLERRYPDTEDFWTELYRMPGLDVRKALETAAEAFCKRLEAVSKRLGGVITAEIAAENLELLYRFGMVSYVFVIVSSLSCYSETLLSVQKWAVGQFTYAERELMQLEFERISRKYENREEGRFLK